MQNFHMICVKRMPWSNVRIFLKLASQRCQLLSVGSIQEASAGHRSGSFESDALSSTSNARHMECLFAKWLGDTSSVNGVGYMTCGQNTYLHCLLISQTWQNFFKGMVEKQIDSQPPRNKEAEGDVLPSVISIFFNMLFILQFLSLITDRNHNANRCSDWGSSFGKEKSSLFFGTAESFGHFGSGLQQLRGSVSKAWYWSAFTLNGYQNFWHIRQTETAHIAQRWHSERLFNKRIKYSQWSSFIDFIGEWSGTQHFQKLDQKNVAKKYSRQARKTR